MSQQYLDALQQGLAKQSQQYAQAANNTLAGQH